MSCRALRRAHWPHFVHQPTRSAVRATFRGLLRAVRRIPDPLARDALARRTADSFAAYSYVTDPIQIDALLRHAATDLETIRQAVDEHQPKAIRKVLDEAFEPFRVRRSPLARLLPRRRDKSAPLPWAFNNICMPPPRSFAEHANNMIASQHSMYRFIRFLRENNFRNSKSGGKLVLEPSAPKTILGNPLSAARRHNVLRKFYDDILRNARKPVHPTILAHLDTQAKNPRLPRQFRRRYQDCARDYYSVGPGGEMIKTKFAQGLI